MKNIEFYKEVAGLVRRDIEKQKYLLPPEGFAVSLPGKIEAYSALNKAGKRSDYMREGDLVYVAGKPDVAEIDAQYDYTVVKNASSVELTPAPFKKAETVTLQVPFSGRVKVDGVDRSGKVLTAGEFAVNNGKVALPVDGKVFRYVIKQK